MSPYIFLQGVITDVNLLCSGGSRIQPGAGSRGRRGGGYGRGLPCRRLGFGGLSRENFEKNEAIKWCNLE